MMLTIALVFAGLILEPASAFKPLPSGVASSLRNPSRRSVRPAMQAPPVIEEEEETPVVEDTPVKEKEELKNWIPFLPRPDYLDGTYAGDVGFDPLGMVTRDKFGPMGDWWYDLGGADTTEKKLKFMREAEMKHGRLAMLAAMGWPLSELLQGALPAITQNPEASALFETAGRAPSVLNGGLDLAAPVLGLAAVLGAFLEVMSMKQVLGHNTTAGDFGFDPMGFYSILEQFQPPVTEDQRTDPEFMEAYQAKARKQMELAEIKNGRLAMLGITGFAFAEALWEAPVTALTPQFFMPFILLPEFNNYQ